MGLATVAAWCYSSPLLSKPVGLEEGFHTNMQAVRVPGKREFLSEYITFHLLYWREANGL